MLTGQGAATINSMNTQVIYTTLDRFLPGSLANAITDVFSNIIMILWYSGVQILIFLSALQKLIVLSTKPLRLTVAPVGNAFGR